MQPQKGVTMVKEAGDLKGNIIKNKGGEFQQAGCGQLNHATTGKRWSLDWTMDFTSRSSFLLLRQLILGKWCGLKIWDEAMGNWISRIPNIWNLNKYKCLAMIHRFWVNLEWVSRIHTFLKAKFWNDCQQHERRNFTSLMYAWSYSSSSVAVWA